MPDDGPVVDPTTDGLPAERAHSNLVMRPDTNCGETTNSSGLSKEFADAKTDMSGSPAPDNHPPASGREQVLAAFARKRAPVQRIGLLFRVDPRLGLQAIQGGHED